MFANFLTLYLFWVWKKVLPSMSTRQHRQSKWKWDSRVLSWLLREKLSSKIVIDVRIMIFEHRMMIFWCLCRGAKKRISTSISSNCITICPYCAFVKQIHKDCVVYREFFSIGVCCARRKERKKKRQQNFLNLQKKRKKEIWVALVWIFC